MKKNSKKTKILAVGDLHGDERLVKKIAKKAEKEKVDLVILTGDLTFAETSTKNIIGPFVKAKKQVLLIPGNHESVATVNFLAELYPNTKNIHGYHFIKDDLGVFGAGGADIGIHQIKDSEILGLLRKGNEKIKGLDKKIMVTHIHPKGTKSELFGFEGSKAVRDAIEKFQPDIAVFSHIHEAAGFEEKIGKTHVINVSRKEKIFEI
jgi:Icc-related predicted phosphoesterase|tara:strand:- start:1252 stop:1872 length:621 start_codon:yes stop_codon:yes gene_type:complete